MRLILRKTGIASLIIIGAVGLAMGLTRSPSPLIATDRIFEGIAYRFFAPSRSIDDRIVIVSITEDTLAQLPYRSPIDRHFLAGLIDTLMAQNVHAIGVDLIFDRATDPDKDAALRLALDRATHPVILATMVDPTLPVAQRVFLNDFLTDRRTGLANLPRESFDNLVRSYLPFTDGLPHFATTLAETEDVRPPDAPFLIAWRHEPTTPFTVYPAHLIGMLPPEWLHDKIVLIGTMIPGQDEHRTPISLLSRPLYGVEIHAYALAQMLDGTIVPPSSRLPIVTVVGITLLGGLVAAYSSGIVLLLGFTILLMFIWVGFMVLFIETGVLLLPMAPTLGLGLAVGGIRYWVGRRERHERQMLHHMFSRFVSEPVVRELWKERDTFFSGGRPRPQELIATVLFSDIAGFTTLTEKLPPGPLYHWLDQYVDAMVAVVNAHEGVVLRFIGDGILAVFGAPIARYCDTDITIDARHAVACAIAMTATVRKLNEAWQAEGMPKAAIRVGLYTGPLFAGSLGSELHMEYVLQGDTVNIAARLEALGKNYLRQGDEHIILVGQPTWDRLVDKPGTKVDEVKLKGKEMTVGVYRIEL